MIELDREEGLFAVRYSHPNGRTLRDCLNAVAFVECINGKEEARRVMKGIPAPEGYYAAPEQSTTCVFELTPEREQYIRSLADRGWTVEVEE